MSNIAVCPTCGAKLYREGYMTDGKWDAEFAEWLNNHEHLPEKYFDKHLP
jgi:hypothetical protein